MLQKCCSVIPRKGAALCISIPEKGIAFGREANNFRRTSDVIRDLLRRELIIIRHRGHKLTISADDVAEVILQIELHGDNTHSEKAPELIRRDYSHVALESAVATTQRPCMPLTCTERPPERPREPFEEDPPFFGALLWKLMAGLF